MSDEDLPAMMDGKTEWSMDLATLQRINLLLWRCNEAQTTDDVEMWFKALMCLYKEAMPEMERRDKTGKHYGLQKNRKKLQEQVRDYRKKATGYAHLSMKDQKKYPFFYNEKIFEEFSEYENKLRLLLDKAGLLMKRQEGGYSF